MPRPVVSANDDIITGRGIEGSGGIGVTVITEVYIPPPETTAANFVPSAEDVIDSQFAFGADVCWIHVTPESELVYIPPP
jgi:hypothetical protein